MLLEAAVGKPVAALSGDLALALCTVQPAPDDTGATLAGKELDTPGYARAAVPASAWGSAENYEIKNSAAIPLPQVSQESPAITGFALIDTGGRVRFRGETRPFHLSPEDSAPQIPVGIMRVSLSG